MNVSSTEFTSETSLSKVINQLLKRIGSKENQRRLTLQKALNRREKVFAFNSWQWSAGLPVGDALTPVPGMSIKDIALNLNEIDVNFARMIIEKQLQNQIHFFDQADSDTPIAAQVFTNMGLSWLYSLHPIGEVCVVKSENGAFVKSVGYHPHQVGSGLYSNQTPSQEPGEETGCCRLPVDCAAREPFPGKTSGCIGWLSERHFSDPGGYRYRRSRN